MAGPPSAEWAGPAFAGVIRSQLPVGRGAFGGVGSGAGYAGVVSFQNRLSPEYSGSTSEASWKTLAATGALPATFHCVEPMGYLEFNHLVKHAFAVVTDSGGVTEETTVMGVPCMTLRDNTERPETVEIGTNALVGTDPEAMAPYFDRLNRGLWKKGAVPPLWDGQAAKRIVGHLEKLV